MATQIKIPVNKQKFTAVGGIDILHLNSKEKPLTPLKDHRDEYYVLAIVIKGSGILKCDMGTIPVVPKSIVIIKPYQVHSGDLNYNDSEGYFISIAPFLLPAICRDVFDNAVVSEQCKKPSSLDMNTLLKTIKLLHHAFNADSLYKVQITVNLLNAIVFNVCALFSLSDQKPGRKENQSFTLTQKFKVLVSQHSFLRAPSFFAEKLYISTSHLNDCVKATTGMSVTQFLQQSMLLEAKRQLYYTNDDVKTVAFTLGFEDHTYFSRIFKKLSNETPLAFRSKFRE